MTNVRLETLGRVALHGERGPVTLSDPRQVALLIRLAGAPGRSLATEEILLCIWPHLTAKEGLEELRGAGAAIARATGGGLVTEDDGQWRLDGEVDSDLESAGPAWADGFLAGFGLPDTPEWDTWVTATKREIASRPPPRRRRWPAYLVAGALVLGGIAELGYLATRPRIPRGFAVGDRVILADIENLTGDSTLGRTLQTAAFVGLQQSTRIDLYSRGRILGSLRSIGRTLGPGGLTKELALEVALRDGVQWVVAIEVRPDRDRTWVTARMFRAGTGETVMTLTEPVAAATNPVPAVDRTLRDLQRGLGESAQGLRIQPALAFATTGDLEALRAFTDGSAAWRRGEYQLAQNYWLRAVALDTGFAMAMGALGGYYYYQEDREEGGRYYRRALARAGRLTEWERLRLESGFTSARGDLDSALVLDRRIVATFPRGDTYYALGTALLQRDRCREAIPVLERSRDLDPAALNTAINLATCHKQLGQYEAARLAYLAAQLLDSTALYANNINLEYAGTVLRTGRVAEAESALTRMTRQPGMTDQALGFRGMGYLAFWRGQLTQAREHFGRASAISRQQGAGNSLLRNLALLAAVQRAAGEPEPSLVEVDSLTAIPRFSPAVLALAVEPHAAAGHVATVRTLLDRVRRRSMPGNLEDSMVVQYVGGILALLERHPDAALGWFARASALRLSTGLALSRAMAYQQLGRLDSAEVLLGRIVGSPVFGAEGQISWIRALIAIADIEERLGRPGQAVASYRRFLDQWKDGDSNIPDVIRARARLNALLAGRDR